jgi:hypothetical protein
MRLSTFSALRRDREQYQADICTLLEPISLKKFPRSPSESCWEVWDLGAYYKNVFAIGESLQALKKSAAAKKKLF